VFTPDRFERSTAASPVVAVIGTMDTKGDEFAFVCDLIRRHSCRPLVIDVGVLGTPRGIVPDVSRVEVAEAAGRPLEEVATLGRGPAVEVMGEGVATIARKLQGTGAISGIMSMGGAEGTVLGCLAMNALPVGFPKVMVSAIANGERRFGDFTGLVDIHMSNSVVDVAGFSRVSRAIYRNAAASVCGMASAAAHDDEDAGASDPGAGRPVVGVTMLGNTQAAFDGLQARLGDAYELLPFHANGTGGPTMERLVEDGLIDLVIDLTPSEVSNELRRGVMASQTDTRLQVAGPRGIAQVVVPGCVDFFQAGALEDLPDEWRVRPIYQHNPHFTLVKATHDEMVQAGTEFARRLNLTVGELVLIWPSGGLSLGDAPGGVFWDPEADQLFLDALLHGLTVPHRLVGVAAHINDDATVSAICDAVESLTHASASALRR
jgi:uncharacterized protein (UPF0261 family)